MAIQRFTIDGYGQLELNQVAFRRDGRIEAQCALNTDDFSATAPAENGMILAIDQVNREITLPKSTSTLFGLNYTTEHMYDERQNALKDFYLVPDTFYPRLGYLDIGDKFTTNCVCYDTEDFADDDALLEACEDIKSDKLYGTVSETGVIQIVKQKTQVNGPFLEMVKLTTMPDTQTAFKFQVLNAQ